MLWGWQDSSIPTFQTAHCNTHSSTATYTAYRRNTPKLLWINHPDLKYSIQKLHLSCEKEGNGTDYTACPCVIKKPVVAAAQDGRGKVPLAQAVAQLLAPRLNDLTRGSSTCTACCFSQCSPGVEASNAHCKNARGLQPAELFTLTQNTCFPILLVCFLMQCCWRRAMRTTE